MSDLIDDFKLPSELSILLSPADQERVRAQVVEINVRLSERDPELEDNRGRGLHLWLLFDAIAAPLQNAPDFKHRLVPDFIPRMIAQIRRDQSWYPHNQEDLTYFLAPRIKRWLNLPTATRSENASENPAKRTTRKSGRHANLKRRDAIHSAITQHGNEWRDHLSEIFTELDSNDVSLGDFEGREIDLGDGESAKVWKWEDHDLAQGEQRKQIIDALRKYAD